MKIVGLFMVTMLAIGARVSLHASPDDTTDASTDLWQSNYEPLHDPGRGMLLEEAADLLEEARALPEEVMLRPETESEEEEESGEDEEQEEGWVKLLDSPPVDEERFARACQKAGRYEEAAKTYSDLIEENPDARHYQKMWFISRRLAGDRVDDVTDEMSDRDMKEPDEDWLEWSSNVDRLDISLEKGGNE